ncbi:MAG: phytanoyl-CoA dioxygenase family protein [Gammaproteobacteria bacterium]
MFKIDSRLAGDFHRDGVVHLPQALDRATLGAAEDLFQWSLEHPTPSACRFYADATGDGGTFYQDLCHPHAALAYRELLEDAPLADLVARLWDAREVWFLYEQVFLKEGGATRRTPWHQDAPYLALDDEQLAVVWINFDPVTKDASLEFVRGSHHGTLYDGSAFDASDDTAGIYGHGLPRLPDIEADRGAWDIVSWAIEPGDVVVFHPAILHGGAPTGADSRRRTLSLRFFGADAVYAARPAPAPAPLVAGLHQALAPGQPFRHPAFPRLRPSPLGFDTIPAAPGGHTVALREQWARH